MKIAILIYPEISRYDLYGLVEPLEKLRALGLQPGLQIDYCTPATLANRSADAGVPAAQAANSLSDYAAVLAPGGPGAEFYRQDPAFLDWLRTAGPAPLKATAGNGAGLLASAGLEDVLTAPAGEGALALGLQVCERLAGPEGRKQVAAALGIAPVAPTTVLPPRHGQVSRETRETRVQIELDLDGSGQHDIHTGVPFFDHMLTQVAVHGLFDLSIAAQGDLEVDCHHTIEDVGLALGRAFDQALGDRKGLVRMASAYVPMDESLALAVIDLSGRPYAVVEAEWNGPEVGRVPVTLFPHFLESFAVQARCNLHVRLLAGHDDHHRAEAIFKAFGRALDAATQLDPRRAGAIPSSKGTL